MYLFYVNIYITYKKVVFDVLSKVINNTGSSIMILHEYLCLKGIYIFSPNTPTTL